MLYHSREPESQGSLVIEWFKRQPRGTTVDFERWIVEKYGLQPYDLDQFDALVGK